MAIKKLARRHSTAEYAELAATTLAFDGARVIGRRIVPDDGYTIEPDEKTGVAYLRRPGGGNAATISCDCGLEGGGCVIVVGQPGDIDESAFCVPDEGCGTSGLFCFLDIDFGNNFSITVRV